MYRNNTYLNARILVSPSYFVGLRNFELDFLSHLYERKYFSRTHPAQRSPNFKNVSLHIVKLNIFMRPLLVHFCIRFV